MANELAGKVAIVTGGARGIGAATVELFAQEGAKVVIADIDAEHGEALATRLGSAVAFRSTNVADRQDVQGLVDFAIERFGGLHIMFNNAAISGQVTNRFLDDPLADFDTVMRVNLAGVMYGAQSAARHMAVNGGGSIINTASIGAMAPGYALCIYRSAKAGVITLTRSLAVDLGEYLIRVNAISPGHIPTRLNNFSATGISPEHDAELQALLDPVFSHNQPLKRQGSPVDVAQMAMFLGSDRSAQITGQVIAVDGGVTAGDPVNLNGLMNETRRSYLEAHGVSA